MHPLNTTLRLTVTVFFFAGQVYAQEGSSTTVTLPGGFTISTTSLIVGTLAVVVVAVVGVVFAARRSHSGHTTNTIFQNVSDSSFGNVKSQTRVATHENSNAPGAQSTRYSSSANGGLRIPTDEQLAFERDFSERIARALQQPVDRDEIKEHVEEPLQTRTRC